MCAYFRRLLPYHKDRTRCNHFVDALHFVCMLQCAVVCYSELQYVALYSRVSQCVVACRSVYSSLTLHHWFPTSTLLTSSWWLQAPPSQPQPAQPHMYTHPSLLWSWRYLAFTATLKSLANPWIVYTCICMYTYICTYTYIQIPCCRLKCRRDLFYKSPI